MTETVKLDLGDVVEYGWESGYDHATVQQVNPDGTVDLFRVYVQTADFSYTGGVICYVGVNVDKNISPSTIKLIRKGQPLR